MAAGRGGRGVGIRARGMRGGWGAFLALPPPPCDVEFLKPRLAGDEVVWRGEEGAGGRARLRAPGEPGARVGGTAQALAGDAPVAHGRGGRATAARVEGAAAAGVCGEAAGSARVGGRLATAPALSPASRPTSRAARARPPEPPHNGAASTPPSMPL